MTQNRINKDIEEVIGDVVDLELGGTSDRPYYKALCPFHEDQKPSFLVFPKTQRYTCYVCGGGDVIDFVARFYNIDRADAELRATDLITVEEAMRRALREKKNTDLSLDENLLNRRLKKLVGTFDLDQALEYMETCDRLIAKGSWMRADKYLKELGV